MIGKTTPKKPTKQNRLSVVEKLKQTIAQNAVAYAEIAKHRDALVERNKQYEVRITELLKDAAYKTAAHDKAIKERESLANIITEIEKASGELQKAAKEQAAKDRDSLNAVVSRLGKAAKEVHIHPFGKRTVNFDKTAGEAIDGYLADQAK